MLIDTNNYHLTRHERDLLFSIGARITRAADYAPVKPLCVGVLRKLLMNA